MSVQCIFNLKSSKSLQWVINRTFITVTNSRPTKPFGFCTSNVKTMNHLTGVRNYHQGQLVVNGYHRLFANTINKNMFVLARKYAVQGGMSSDKKEKRLNLIFYLLIVFLFLITVCLEPFLQETEDHVIIDPDKTEHNN